MKKNSESKGNAKIPAEIPPRPDLERVKAMLPLWDHLIKLIHLTADKEKLEKFRIENFKNEPNDIAKPKKPKPGCKK
ncbi:MAG: hypothetical protein AB7I18_11150 [Candidatus Berkiella sp.]